MHNRLLHILLLAVVLLGTPARAQDAQRRATYWYVEAMKHKLAGHTSAVLDLLRHCLRVDPSCAPALYETALYEYHFGHDTLGLDMLQRAATLEPSNADYHEALASAYLQIDSMRQAANELERLYALQPSRTEVLEQLVKLYRYNEEPERAIDALTRIERIEGRTNQSAMQKFNLYADMDRKEEGYACLRSLCDEAPHDMSCRLMLARQYVEDGRAQEAAPLFDEVRRLDPKNPTLQLSLLLYYTQTGQREAHAHLRDSLLYGPDVPVALRHMVVAQLVQQAQDSATLASVDTVFQRVLAIEKRDVDLRAAYLVYLNYVHQGDMTYLLPTLHTILDLAPDHLAALQQLLQYYIGQNDLAQIEALSRQGIQYHTDEVLFHYFLGAVLYQQDRTDEAILALETGARQDERDDDARKAKADIYSLLGDAYYQAGRRQEAFAAYDSCLVRDADNVACLNNYAYYLSLRREHLDRAEQMSYRTVRLQPDSKTYLDTYAWILFEQGDYEMARSYIDRVVPPEADDSTLQTDPDLSAEVLTHAADICSMTGQTQRALHLWQLALEADPDNKLLRRKIAQKKYIKE